MQLQMLFRLRDVTELPERLREPIVRSAVSRKKLARTSIRFNGPLQVAVRGADPANSVIGLRGIRMFLDDGLIDSLSLLPVSGGKEIFSEFQPGRQVIGIQAQRLPKGGLSF
jgi:hypothetical protein